MRPVDQFLSSVRDVFATNRDTDWSWIGLAVAAGLAAVIVLGRWRVRRVARQAVAEQIDTVATGAGLARADRDFLSRIAGAAGLPVLDVLTSLGSFERATARAFGGAGTPPPLRPAEGSVWARVRRLRKALGFSPLPAHHWLLSTRELVAGDPVSAAGATGPIVDVNEAIFAVDLPAAAAVTTGATAALAIVRTDDSRYLARARVLAIEPAPPSLGVANRRVFFGHDEKPSRQQDRAHVRVRVRVPVSVQVAAARAPAAPSAPGGAPPAPDPAPPATGAASPATGPATPADARDAESPPSPAADTPIANGMSVDVSAGGLALDLPITAAGPLRGGSRVWCSFDLGEGATFDGLAAAVAAARPGPALGVQAVRLSFTALPNADRDRLAAAVARHLRAAASDDGGGERAT